MPILLPDSLITDISPVVYNGTSLNQIFVRHKIDKTIMQSTGTVTVQIPLDYDLAKNSTILHRKYSGSYSYLGEASIVFPTSTSTSPEYTAEFSYAAMTSQSQGPIPYHFAEFSDSRVGRGARLLSAVVTFNWQRRYALTAIGDGPSDTWEEDTVYFTGDINSSSLITVMTCRSTTNTGNTQENVTFGITSSAGKFRVYMQGSVPYGMGALGYRPGYPYTATLRSVTFQNVTTTEQQPYLACPLVVSTPGLFTAELKTKVWEFKGKYDPIIYAEGVYPSGSPESLYTTWEVTNTNSTVPDMVQFHFKHYDTDTGEYLGTEFESVTPSSYFKNGGTLAIHHDIDTTDYSLYGWVDIECTVKMFFSSAGIISQSKLMLSFYDLESSSTG